MAEDMTRKNITIENGFKVIDARDDAAQSSSVDENLLPHIDKKIRKQMDAFNMLSIEEVKYDKSSPEHMYIHQEKEKIGRSIINIKNQEQKYNENAYAFKQDLSELNPGTKNEDLHINTAVYGAQSRAVHIDDDGNMSFLLDDVDITAERNSAYEQFSETGEWNENEGEVVLLNDMGARAIVKEPYTVKAFVFKLADKSKNDKDSGKQFDEKWTYNSSLSNITDSGPKGTIGAAFADLAGDGQTKSFAEMYVDGLNKEYYIHPDTGQPLPAGSEWMKDSANSKILAKLLARYITNVMKDIHTPTIDETTGQIKKSQSQLAQEIIEKYSK